MSYNAKNYTEQGGDVTHFGGKVVFEDCLLSTSKILLSRLSGNSAFKSKEDKEVE